MIAIRKAAWLLGFAAFIGAVARAQPALAGMPPYVRAVAFSPDGTLLVAGYGTSKDEPGGVRTWEVATGRQKWDRSEAAWVPSISFAHDGHSLAIANGSKAALRLDPQTGKELGEIGPHPAAVRAVAYIPETDLLATGHDSIILLWNVKTGIIHRPLVGHTKEIRSLEASPDGRWLTSGGQDPRRYWDVAAGTELKNVSKYTRSYAFVGPNQLLMSSSDPGHRIVDFPDGTTARRIASSVLSERIAYSSSAKLVAFYGTGNPFVHVTRFALAAPAASEWTQIEALIKQFDDDSIAIREAASAKIGEIGLVADPLLHEAMNKGPSAEVRMRAREARQSLLDVPRHRLSGFVGDLGSMAFSPDGKSFAAGGEDGMVHVWDSQTGRASATFPIR